MNGLRNSEWNENPDKVVEEFVFIVKQLREKMAA